MTMRAENTPNGVRTTLPENALDVAGRNTAAAPGLFRGCGGRPASRQRRTESENILRGDAVGALG